MQGFFPIRQASQIPVALVPRCGVCGLLNLCRTPKMPVSGEGRKKVLIVGEAPVKSEDEQGRPFVGNSGHALRTVLKRIGVDADRDCWFTNSIICRPPSNDLSHGLKKGDKRRIDYCRPNLLNTIRQLSPDVVILLGASPVRSLIGSIWPGASSIDEWSGWRIPLQRPNLWACPTYHPAYLLYQKDQVLDRFFEAHLRSAFALQGKPWSKPPDFVSQVEVLHDADEAVRLIRIMIRKGGNVAFDIESNMLKPDREDSEIVCCAVCWRGKRTIAFPWYGEAIKVMRELVLSDLGKIASNLKMEDRWCQKVFGCQVRNWVWDTVLSAHCLDNRQGTKGLKFQAFVNLGQPPYDGHVKEYLKAKGGNEVNRIREADYNTLARYNGQDAVLTYKVAQIQAKNLGVKL